MDNKNLRFVLKHYKSGALDTRKALAAFHRHIDPEESRWRKLPSYWRGWGRLAAVVLVLLLVGAGWLWTNRSITISSGDQQQVCLLEDGTRITLAPHATLSYHARDCRKVHFSGKAYFEVHHDTVRPFDVSGELGHVRVLGTKFMVSESATASRVFVTSGRVLFTAVDEPTGIYLTRGQAAILKAKAHHPSPISSPDPNVAAWATHEFHFDHTPLPQVLRTLSTYYGLTFTANDTTRQLTGDFDARDRETVVSIIEQTLNINIKQQTK